jgi:hypothetical protein
MTFHSLNISPPYNLFIGPKPSANQSSTNHNRIVITLFIHCLFYISFNPSELLYYIYICTEPWYSFPKVNGYETKDLVSNSGKDTDFILRYEAQMDQSPTRPFISFFISPYVLSNSSRPVAETHAPFYWVLFISMLVSGYNFNPSNHRHLHPSIFPKFMAP